jgi:hypothetical protein
VRLRRIGGTDQVRIIGLDSNTVYTITAAGALPTLTDGEQTFDLVLVPSRCDVHALGESYRTSLIGLVYALGNAAPRSYVLAPAPAIRRQIEAFAVQTCRAGR